MNTRRHSDVARGVTRVVINMQQNTVMVMPSWPQQEFESGFMSEFDYGSSFSPTEPVRHRSSSLDTTHTMPTKQNQFVFVDEAQSFNRQGKVMKEAHHSAKKKEKPGFDEMTRLFRFK
jgi:hypothetical protein